jgi:hypothetical protein
MSDPRNMSRGQQVSPTSLGWQVSEFAGDGAVGQFESAFPRGLKPALILSYLTYGLKPVPFKLIPCRGMGRRTSHTCVGTSLLMWESVEGEHLKGCEVECMGFARVQFDCGLRGVGGPGAVSAELLRGPWR